MPARFVPRAPVLPTPRQPGEAGRFAVNPHGAAARATYVLSARDPLAQRRDFMRPGALDVK